MSNPLNTTPTTLTATDVPQPSNSYFSPKLAAREMPGKGGHGVFAVEPIEAEEILIVWGGGVFPQAAFDALPVDVQTHALQIDEDMYMVPAHGVAESADLVNHSCEPNAGLRGQIILVAMRPIAAGEEVCFDYAMCDSSPYDEFQCGCGLPTCRGTITGNDWKLPQLWDKYYDYFSSYLKRRIHALKAQTA